MQVKKQPPNLRLKIFGGNSTEQGGYPHLIVNVHSCGAATDGIDTRQVRCRTLKGVVDALDLIARVIFKIGIPLNLLGEDDFPINHRGTLAIRAAEVKADPASVDVSAEWYRCLIFRRDVLHGTGADC